MLRWEWLSDAMRFQSRMKLRWNWDDYCMIWDGISLCFFVHLFSVIKCSFCVLCAHCTCTYLTLNDACNICWASLHDTSHVRAEFLLRTKFTTNDAHAQTTHCDNKEYRKNASRNLTFIFNVLTVNQWLTLIVINSHVMLSNGSVHCIIDMFQCFLSIDGNHFWFWKRSGNIHAKLESVPRRFTKRLVGVRNIWPTLTELIFLNWTVLKRAGCVLTSYLPTKSCSDLYTWAVTICLLLMILL